MVLKSLKVKRLRLKLNLSNEKALEFTIVHFVASVLLAARFTDSDVLESRAFNSYHFIFLLIVEGSERCQHAFQRRLIFCDCYRARWTRKQGEDFFSSDKVDFVFHRVANLITRQDLTQVKRMFIFMFFLL